MRCGAAVNFPKRNARQPFSYAGWRPSPPCIATRALFPGGNGDWMLVCALSPLPIVQVTRLPTRRPRIVNCRARVRRPSAAR